MKDCIVLVAPGGNPAPIATLAWALHRQRDLRAVAIRAVLYERARRWVERELLGGDEPLVQLRATLTDPDAAHLELRPVLLPDGSPLQDDVDPAAAMVFTEAVWAEARALQATTDLPVVFALVGGRRRTLTVDLALTFQLLARPQDRLVDLRFDPKGAEHPSARFYFPEQSSPARVPAHGGVGLLDARQVVVQVVDVAVPRLRRLLCDEALQTFAGALQVGEDALEHGPVARLEIHVLEREVRLGVARVRLGRDQFIWMVALALARMEGQEDGWLDPTDTALLARAFVHCRKVWMCPEGEISDGYDLRPEVADIRWRWLNPIRSRLRATLRRGLAGHPHRDLVVPALTRNREGSRERISIPPSRIGIMPPFERGSATVGEQGSTRSA